MNSVYDKARVEYFNMLKEKIRLEGERLNVQPIWSEPRPINEKNKKGEIPNHPISKAIGVYRIIYKPTMVVMYIGCGRIVNRKTRHRDVHGNGGKPILHLNSSSSSQAGIHMYKHDKDINNWLFQWCDVGSVGLSEIYELKLQQEEKPQFNNPNMAGK